VRCSIGWDWCENSDMNLSVDSIGPISLDRMVSAVQKVRDRLLRSTAALGASGVPYAVAGAMR